MAYVTKLAQLGDIRGFVVSRTDSDTISISAGYCEANGVYYESSSAISKDFTPEAGGDIYYVYIDHGVTAPVPTIIVSTTEPVYSISKLGLYNGNDRYIGEFYAVSSSIPVFIMLPANPEQAGAVVELAWTNVFNLANAQNSANAYTAPNVADTDTYIGKGGVEALIEAHSTDTGSTADVSFVSKEVADIWAGTAALFGDAKTGGSQTTYACGWMSLGSSRQSRFATSGNDDNALGANLIRYRYRR
jgi:hypothetical protein